MFKYKESNNHIFKTVECPYCGSDILISDSDMSSDDYRRYKYSCNCSGEDFSRKAERFFKNMYSIVMKQGKEVKPRGLLVKEIEDVSIVIPNYVRYVNFKRRKFNLDYVKREFLWYLRADKYDTSICQYAKMWKNFINDDGSINSNYGQYLFGNGKQIYQVIKTLWVDKDSRRACAVILQPYHLLTDGMKEIPCTCYLNFRIRDDKLNMSVHMRSQDAVIGFASDIPIFSYIHEMVYVYLQSKYANLQLGRYYHHVNSFHIYEKHFDMVNDIISSEGEYNLIKTPPICSLTEVEVLLNIYKGIDVDDYIDYCAFLEWLTKIERSG